MKRLIVAAVVLASLATPTLAVNPDEVLDDPVLEQRARDISAGLRCVVCRGENIDESNAAIAKDLRLLVRERLVEGDSNSEVVAFIVERYGEYVLMKPTATGANIVLWLAGPVLFLIAAITGVIYLRRRAQGREKDDGLSKDEARRLEELMEG
ncbi:cytochrome C biogenesis protein CcdA [Aliiroseovarius crassostreae]|uniref:Cytochrome c-type biogenesis protein n=1 Tax=Aliiroseovarius crassostreae TaxID=154981 RepID=A0A0N8IBQ8_9RHOB|nr:cytochrome c-type biogenesis protein [Aliiroseovarius crassostreae]KPN63787.1 cytochrome C biogenesis protein CcdA [Aliiroseovarius crassostreae]